MDSRPTFIESICISDGEVQLLDHHQIRVNKALAKFYPEITPIILSKIIDCSEVKDQKVKCRIVYGNDVKSVSYTPYILKPINSLRTVTIDSNYDYSHKYEDRSALEHYYSLRAKSDDIIMIKDGFVTDSYYGNLALLKDDSWYTPDRPLLQGTRRTQLIKDNQIIPRRIGLEDIIDYEAVSVINAMIDLGEIIIGVDNIFY